MMRQLTFLISLVLCLSLTASAAVKPDVIFGSFEQENAGFVKEGSTVVSFDTFGATTGSYSWKVVGTGGWATRFKAQIRDTAVIAKIIETGTITFDLTLAAGSCPDGWFQVIPASQCPANWWFANRQVHDGTTPGTYVRTFTYTEAERAIIAQSPDYLDFLIITQPTATFWVDSFRVSGDPVPAPHAVAVDPYYEAVDVPVSSSLAWASQADIPDDPNMAIVGYKVFLDTVESNVANAVAGGPYDVTALDADSDSANTSWSSAAPLAYETEYFWRVDTIVQYDYKVDPNLISNKDYIFSFTTMTDDPIVSADSVITTLDLMPASLVGTISDDNGDLTSATWELLVNDDDYPASVVERECMQLQVRSQIYPTDPNLLIDWIGTDTREKGDPLVLTISGLPAGTYTWTSYHHDPADQTGMFDVTFNDADGPQTISDVDISAGLIDPVTTVIATVVSDGSDVTIVFDQHAYSAVTQSFFVLNGFILDNGVNMLKIDFGTATSPIQPGFAVYTAANEVVADFGPKTFSAFGGTDNIIVNPDWLGETPPVINASLISTTSDIYNPTATFTTDTVGTYKVRLTGTDAAAQTDSYITEIRVYADACAAAKANPNGYTAPIYDFDNDCEVDIDDLVTFASQWMLDKALSDEYLFTSPVTYTPIVQP